MVCPVVVESFRVDRQTDIQKNGRKETHEEANSNFPPFSESISKISAHFERSNVRIAVLIANLLAVGTCFAMESLLPRCYMTLSSPPPNSSQGNVDYS